MGLIITAEFLKPLDQVVGYGVVSSVNEFHSAACKYYGKCDPACKSRVLVQFNQAADEFVFQVTHDLDVFRPGDATAELADTSFMQVRDLQLAARRPSLTEQFESDADDGGW